MHNTLIGFIFIVWWILGVVVANGFTSTLVSIIIPFYSWYLFAEFALTKIGWIV